MQTASIVSFETVQGVAVARITAPTVSERESSVILAEGQAALKPARHRLIIDMSQVTMLASTGLGMLVTLSKGAKSGGGRLVLCGLNKQLKELLRMTKLDKVLTIVQDESKALEKAK